MKRWNLFDLDEEEEFSLLMAGLALFFFALVIGFSVLDKNSNVNTLNTDETIIVDTSTMATIGYIEYEDTCKTIYKDTETGTKYIIVRAND